MAFTSLIGIAVPFTVGLVLGLNLPDTYLVDPERRLLFSFFIATALSISAIPLVAKILMDLNLLRTSVGQTILGSAIVNDLVGWILFAIILSMLNTATHGHGSVLELVTLTVAFAAGCLTIGSKLVLSLFEYFKTRNFPSERILGIAVLIAFLCAAFTQWIGIHAIFGAQASAANLTAVLAGSAIVASHRTGDPRVQDAYSLRCAPQVHGAARDALAFAEACAERELAAAIDNPVVLPDGRIESVGNFHGAPLAHACDLLAIVAADVAAMSERRTDRLLDAARSHGLPPFLADEPGVDSGLMIAQYTAAALVAECRRLAVPASVDNVPTSAMQEDHVSMGWSAARKLRTALGHLGRVLGIEAATAARGIDLRGPLEPAPATRAARDALRSAGVGGPGPDRPLAPELEAAAAVVSSGALVAAVEAEVGALA